MLGCGTGLHAGCTSSDKRRAAEEDKRVDVREETVTSSASMREVPKSKSNGIRNQCAALGLSQLIFKAAH